MADEEQTNNKKTQDSSVKDLTNSVHAEDQNDPTNDPVYQQTRRLVIRIGTVFFVVLAFAMFLPMIVGVGQGIRQQRVWDPYTGNTVKLEGARIKCVDEAQRLMLEAGRHRSLKRVWAEPYRDWSTNCKDEHKELYELLTKTRLQLRKKTLFQSKGQ